MAGASGEAPDLGLRASDADREQVIDGLKTAFVEGRLDKDEFDRRAGLALSARTRADLAAIIADIPGHPRETSLPSRRSRPGMSPSARARTAIIVAPVLADLIAAASGGLAAATGSPLAVAAFLVLSSVALGTTATALVIALVRGLLWIEARPGRHAGRQLPPRRTGDGRLRSAPPATRMGRRSAAGRGPRRTALAISSARAVGAVHSA